MSTTDLPTNVGSNDQFGPTLRPCPFCDSDAYYSGEMLTWRVFCHGCEAANGPYSTQLKAAVQWNKRVIGSAPADPLDIEELFDAAAGADEETHVRFARLLEQHHGIRGA